MAQATVASKIERPMQVGRTIDSRQRALGLAVVLLVSFGRFTANALYSTAYGQPSSDAHQRQWGVAMALMTEATALLLLWFLLSQQGRSWRDIGWNPRWSDVLSGIALAVITLPLSLFTTFVFQLIYHGLTGHYLASRSAHGVLGAGISALTIVFVLVNPFFEELIVRGYTISEITGLGRNAGLAVLASVLIQMSYHIYQGRTRCIGLAVTFTV